MRARRPRRKHSLVGHHCETVPERGWTGKRNGELLALAEEANLRSIPDRRSRDPVRTESAPQDCHRPAGRKIESARRLSYSNPRRSHRPIKVFVLANGSALTIEIVSKTSAIVFIFTYCRSSDKMRHIRCVTGNLLALSATDCIKIRAGAIPIAEV